MRFSVSTPIVVTTLAMSKFPQYSHLIYGFDLVHAASELVVAFAYNCVEMRLVRCKTQTIL